MPPVAALVICLLLLAAHQVAGEGGLAWKSNLGAFVQVSQYAACPPAGDHEAVNVFARSHGGFRLHNRVDKVLKLRHQHLRAVQREFGATALNADVTIAIHYATPEVAIHGEPWVSHRSQAFPREHSECGKVRDQLWRAYLKTNGVSPRCANGMLRGQERAERFHMPAISMGQFQLDLVPTHTSIGHEEASPIRRFRRDLRECGGVQREPATMEPAIGGTARAARHTGTIEQVADVGRWNAEPVTKHDGALASKVTAADFVTGGAVDARPQATSYPAGFASLRVMKTCGISAAYTRYRVSTTLTWLGTKHRRHVPKDNARRLA